MNAKYRAGKRLLTILLTAGVSLALLACQIDNTGADSTNSPESNASPTPTATEQATDAPSEATPDTAEGETTSNDRAGADAETEDEAEELSNGTGAYTITADTAEEGKNYTSEASDENALRVENGCTASVDAAMIEKLSGDSSSIAASQSVGLNAALMLHNGAQFTLTGSDITSDAAGAGALAFGADTYLLIENSTVRTNVDNSCGIVAADGAIIAAKSLTVSTQGNSSAAVCTAQTGGSISITGGTFTTGGVDSPAVSSAGSVSAQDATLRANHSAAISADGGSVTLNNCTVSGNMTAASDEGKEVFYTVLLGDCSGSLESAGQSTLTMTGGLLNANNGDLFYVTNTNAAINLTNVTLSPNNGVLLRVAGIDGQNGGSCNLTATNQILIGNIAVDVISSLHLSLTGGTSFTGSINPDGTAGDATVTLGDDSTWILTSDAYLTGFSGRTKNIETNGYTVYVNGSAITK